MKRLLFTLLLLAASQGLRAQTDSSEADENRSRVANVTLRIPTQVGNCLVGANLLFARMEFQKGFEANYTVGISPKVGFFILPNLATGLTLDLTVEGHTGYRSISYGASPFARIYFGHNYASGARPLQFFVEGGVGFGGTNSRYESAGVTTEATTNGVRLYILPGLDYFLNDRVAVEAGLQYLFIGGKPDAQIIGLNIGFQAFLGR